MSRFAVLAVALFILAGCSVSAAAPTPDINATVVAAVQATRTAEPTATRTPVPPTRTPSPTSTSVPATETPTPVPPTATAVPPTSTRVPPTATPAPPTATKPPAVDPAERAYVDAWNAIHAEYNASIQKVERGGTRTGNANIDAHLGQTERLAAYRTWGALAERVKALAAPPRLRAAHALRVEAFGYLVQSGNLSAASENIAGSQADFLIAQARNKMNQFLDTTARAAAESKKVGW